MNPPTTLEQISGPFFCRLTATSLLHISGEQAAEFLHNQLTANVKTLAEGEVRHYAHCDFKGKAWANGLIWLNDNAYFMTVSATAASACIEQLKKYSVFSKVDIDDVTEQYAITYCSDAQSVSNILGAEHITTSMHSQVIETVQVVSPEPSLAGAYLFAPVAALDTLLATLADADFTQLPEPYFEAAAIRAGIANVAEPNVNQFVPQMMNLQALEAIDFKKGCYMGQEVIARTRYLGKNKRAAFALRSLDATNCAAGDTLEIALGENWRRAGTILRAAVLTNETWVLAVLPNDTADDAVFRLANAPETSFSIEPLPYALDN